ncbi:MAG: hypothetical protein U0163_21440 [Gemmatimonadaceae bacterium]
MRNRSSAIKALLLAGVLAIVAVGCSDPLADTRDVPVTIPWKGLGAEAAVYAINRYDGSGAARGTLTVEELGDKVSFKQSYENDQGTDTIEVISDASTLRPELATRQIHTATITRDLRAEYGATDVHITASGQDSFDETLEFCAHAYDSDQALFLWRTMPLTVGYEVQYVWL